MKTLPIILLILLLASCQVKERPIAYGDDECEYCKMMVMDHRYGSEMVTDKGKVYTFDAAECLIDYLQYNEEMADAAALLLVTSYTDPGHLIGAREASYLVSEKMPSPMGAYLTAFPDLATAENYLADKGGTLYTWEELFNNFKSIRLKAIEDFE